MSKEIFRDVPCKVDDIMKDVLNGKIGLPDLQRPFVWKDSKVRDLLDSMMKGYPIGYIMIWNAPEDYVNAKSIGDVEQKYSKPQDLIIDGQQRVTSLLAAIYGIKICDAKYRHRNIRISYNPLSREFDVWTAATERDKNWIPDISKVKLTKNIRFPNSAEKSVQASMSLGGKKNLLNSPTKKRTP